MLRSRGARRRDADKSARSVSHQHHTIDEIGIGQRGERRHRDDISLNRGIRGQVIEDVHISNLTIFHITPTPTARQAKANPTMASPRGSLNSVIT